jgi:reactive intermediate/imine deaminase
MRVLLAVLLTFAASAAAANPDQIEYRVQIHGVANGKQTVATDSSHVTHVDYSYADRGRGDHIAASWTLDARGIPIVYEASGNDYWKVPFTEKFRLRDGKAVWKSSSESGEKSLTTAAFYLPANSPPEMQAVLVRALLKAPDHRLALLPEGEARLETGKSLEVTGAHGKNTLTQYRISGLNFSPTPVWLDQHGVTAGVLSDWLTTIAPDYIKAVDTLGTAQEEALRDWHQRLAGSMLHQPQGALLIQHARLFDPRDLSVTPGMSVLVVGERIVKVTRDADMVAPKDAEVLDAGGRFLMPGMWDCHQHFSEFEGIFDMVAGVTSARDMANDNLPLMARVKRFDQGTELGPRVSMAGIIEGVGPLAGPTDVRVETPQQAIAAVDWYAEHGYVQVKMYSSVDPKLVPVIAARAHEHGLRVSGHVPAFTYARQFVLDGADEIQHLNFIMLNFLYPEVQETRNKDRYAMVAKAARDFKPGDPRVDEFIGFLRDHHTVLDPTVGILEEMFAGDPTKLPPGLIPVGPRFPAQIRRTLKAGALPVPPGEEKLYSDTFPALLKFFKALYDAGVTIVPGTDSFAGYNLHHELELYVRAGIAPAEVLRMATLTPARVMGVEKDRGVIADGKLADIVLVDGDPSRNISDIRNVYRTIKGGKIIDPAALELALGFSPQRTTMQTSSHSSHADDASSAVSSSPVHAFNSGQVLPAQVPFPEGTRVGDMYFLSGQLGNQPGAMKLVEGGIRPEALQALNNIRTALRAQGLDLQHLARCTVMLADMAEWPQFNEVYRTFFGDVAPPARSAFGVNGLALGARVEIECIAARKTPNGA